MRIATAIATGCALSGCVAAIVPVAAAGAIGKSSGRHRETVAASPAPAETGSSMSATAAPVPNPSPVAANQTPMPMAAPPPAPVPAGAPATEAVPPGMQYLYGSGEAAALSRQAYAALGAFLLARRSDRELGNRVYSVVLTPKATLAKPIYEDCGTKPLAAVFDLDETVLLNAGFERDQLANGNRYDAARWQAWERTGAPAMVTVPGARELLKTARAAKIAVIFNTNRSAANAAGTEAAIERVGFGPAKHGETLFLKGDLGSGEGKDSRRHAISQRYCVVALAGDQLGDFSDLFNAPGQSVAARRAATMTGPIANLWGQGWFVLPNPVYGSGLKGGVDDVFAARTHWAPPPQSEK